MKKLLSIMLAILMVVTMIPMAVMPASAAENESDGVIYCELGPWAGSLTTLKLRYSSDNSTTNDIVMEEVGYNIWKADLSTNNPAGWIVQFLGSNQSAQLSSEGTTIPEGKNCFRITEYNSSSGVYDGVWYQYPCTSHEYNDGTCACGVVCSHTNYTDGKCDVWGDECPHEGQNGSCEICGENLGKLVIDVTDKADVSIGNGQTYYDEDGYIITGTNKDLIVYVYEEGNFVFRNASFKTFTLNGGDYEVTITLEGDNYLGDTENNYSGISFTDQHLTIDGGENDTLNFNGQANAIGTGGNPGTCTVNGGKINAVTETDQNYSTLESFGGFIMNGGEVTLSNNHYYVVSCPVTLNGGVLNVIGTSTDCAAVNHKITVEKGALLTVSSACGILSDWYGSDIVVADDAEENTLLFAKYNTEDEFAPVYDIKSALDGKTYAEIKADTHNHSFTNDECACGFICEHTDREDGFCTVCKRYIYEITHQPTLEEPYVELNNDADALYQWYTATDKVAEVIDGNEIVDKKENTYYEEETGWNGTWYDGVYVEYFDIYLKAGQKLTLIPDAYCMDLTIYSLVEYTTVESEECEAGTELTYIAENDGWYSIFAYADSDSSDNPRLRAYADAYDYTEIENETSARLEIAEIGKKYACKVTYGDGKTEMSDVFEYAYAITHQPTSGEPYVELNDDTDASYQWYEVERSGSEITDENADTVVYDWGESSYDKETGWTGVAYDENIPGQDFFTVALKAGETVTVELTGDFTEGVGLWNYNINDGIWIDAEEGVSSYEITVGADGDYTFYTVVNSGVVTVKAYAGATNYTAIEGEASAEIKNPEIGKRYACEVTYGNGTTEMTDVLKYSYAITHQPTSEEPYVELNDDTDASYQWHILEEGIAAITDKNASGNWQSMETPFDNSVYEDGKWVADIWGDRQYYFMVELEEGDTVNFEFASTVSAICFSIGDSNEYIEVGAAEYSITVEESGVYWLVIPESPVEYVSATMTGMVYVPVEGQNSAKLSASTPGTYACEVTFADGTTEMSDAFEVTNLHECDFTGEWKYDNEKHWKECTCGETGEEAEHTYTDGKCECGYECTHEWDKGVLTRPVYDAVLGSKDGYYTYTCTLCGEEKTETVKSADYSAYEAVSEEINALLQSDELTDAAKQAIYSAANECGHLSNDLTESEQNIVDDLVAELEKIVADAEEKIASGEYVKVDGFAVYNERGRQWLLKFNDDGVYEKANEIIRNLTDEANAKMEEMYAFALSLEGSVAENAENIAKVEADIDEFFGQIENCLDGVHNGFVYEVTEEAKCEVNAIESATCTLCGETDEREVEGSVLEHSFTKYEETEAPKCGVEGKEISYCDNGCGATDEKEIPALTHKDEDGDLKCDHGCGHEFPKPVDPTPDTPDTPDEPTDDTCDHLCHKDGILGFLWKIISFFYRLFNIQQYCDCGVIHYDTPVFG